MGMKGKIALCSLGCLGLITNDEKQSVSYTTLVDGAPGETVTAGPAATAAPAKQVVTLQRPLQAPRLAGPAVVGPAGSATSDFTPTLPVVDGGVAPSSKPE